MTVEVVAAVIERRDGHYLLAQRPAGKVYAGWWEFPGGKVESDETPGDALARELHEELGIHPTEVYPWITRVHRYEHATVRLNFFRVLGWSGDPHPREGQTFVWQAPGSSSVEPMLPANAAVIAGLALPHEYALTNAAELGVDVQLSRLDKRLQDGLRMVGVREPAMLPADRMRFTDRVLTLAHRHGAKVMLKPDSNDGAADGLHYTTRDLLDLKDRMLLRPIAGASCHSREELERAMLLQFDFAGVGPVLPTLSHPGAPALGWQGFSAIATGASSPVYAIGGLARSDMRTAWKAGAHGIAMIRAAWS
jgi:8-oxo-dGTP diphosphatase